MAQLIRKPETDSVQLAAPGEEIRWTEAFVYTNPTPKTVWQVVNDALVPKQGERRPLGTMAATNFNNSWVCRSVDVTPVPNSPLAWNVRVTWSSRRSQQANRAWFNITRSTQSRTAAMYRSGSGIFDVGNVPANGSAPYPPIQWIDGANVSKVDAYGVPLSVKISQQLIQVDFLWDRTRNVASDVVAGANQANDPDPPSEWTSVYVNTRNNAVFLGWPTGYVTYLGWNANQSPAGSEWLVVSHRFLADDWQHLEQRPCPNQGGLKLIDVGQNWGTSPVIPTQATKLVAWYQPYLTLTNFDSLLNFDLGSGNVLTAIKTPQPAWPP